MLMKNKADHLAIADSLSDFLIVFIDNFLGVFKEAQMYNNKTKVKR